MVKLDARGLSCPEPVVMMSKAMASSDDSYEMIVDNKASKENVTRYANHQGYKVSVQEKAGDYILTITKQE